MNFIIFTYFLSYLGLLLNQLSSYEYKEKDIKKLLKFFNIFTKYKLEYLFLLIIFLYNLILKFWTFELIKYFFFFDISILLFLLIIRKSQIKFNLKNELHYLGFLIIIFIINFSSNMKYFN
jgi:hypothetical protein